MAAETTKSSADDGLEGLAPGADRPTRHRAGPEGMRPATGRHPAVEAEGRERSRLVRGLFAGIAHRYDLVNHVASLGLDRSWRRQVVRELDIARDERVLDACCGTGDLALELERAGARVVAVDFCRPMLVEARRKAAGRRVVAVEGDVLHVPLPDASVAAATVAFGIRNVVDPIAGLAELARCVRPEGKLAVLEFSRPRPRLLRWAHGLYCARVVPFVGDLLTGRRGTYRYLPQTIDAWPTPEAFAEDMRRAGWDQVSYRLLSGGIVALHVGRRAASARGTREPPC